MPDSFARPLLGALALAIAGCSNAPTDANTPTLHWAKPGASREDFMQQRYQCAQEASRQRSGGYVNAYGGVSQSRPVISLSLYTACMGAHGWHQSPEGYSPPPGEKILLED